ncbi:MAG TPA: hypothetical protein VF159_05555 [Gemmatimonadaceae bacterium]
MQKSTSIVLFLVALGAPVATRSAQAQAPGTPPPPPARTLDFSGLIFGNYQFRTDSAAKAANGGQSPNKFDLERVYLTFKLPVGDRLGIRATTDIYQNANNNFYNGWAVRLKYGYLEYKFANDVGGFSALSRIGVLHTVVIDHEETFWPRYLANVAVEKYGWFSSADAGFATQVSLPAKMGEVYATVTNGPGYTAPENDRFKDVAARLTLTPLATFYGFLSSLTISPWYYKGSVASAFATDPVNPITTAVDRNRWGVLAGLKDPHLAAAVHYSRRIDGFESGTNTAGSPVVVTDSTGAVLSAYAIVKPLHWTSGNDKSTLGAVVRWDSYKPRVGVDGAEEFLVAGLQWEPTARTALTVDYQALTPRAFAGKPPITKTNTWFVHWAANF